MKRLQIITIFLLISFALCQISNKSIKPKSMENALEKNIEVVVLPTVNVEKQLEEEKKEEGLAPRYGFAHKVSFNTKTGGTFSTLKDGGRIWRIKFKSPLAFFTTINFSNFFLAPGSTLHIIKKSGEFMGAYTNENIKNQKTGKIEFPIGPIEGDEFTIELYEPKEVISTSILELKTITHAYKDLFGYKGNSQKNGRSGTCNINVVCPQAEGLSDQIRSVGLLLQSSGSRFCTGALINRITTGAGEKKPYFLTAAHCGSNPRGWIVMFNYQADSCAERRVAASRDTINQLSTVARGETTDFHLLSFAETIPAAYNTYLSGWSRADTPERTVSYGLHHPSGDNKKVAVCTTPLTHSQWSIWPRGTHWRVNVWAEGTTEPGSSGSPLFDSNKRIIGQLHGGSAGCRNPSGYDVYGKISRSWERENAPARRLKEHLDPENTQNLVCDGTNLTGAEIAEHAK